MAATTQHIFCISIYISTLVAVIHGTALIDCFEMLTSHTTQQFESFQVWLRISNDLTHIMLDINTVFIFRHDTRIPDRGPHYNRYFDWLFLMNGDELGRLQALYGMSYFQPSSVNKQNHSMQIFTLIMA